ncbi:peptidylprolyl isomerase [Candidatus Sulfurimonas baltica]|uniref:Peptidylprolyl isomerase n=1 Tax=Candidatus Sulfurimonas baltica TaxID=2740404 RepID=A0A7S7LUB0_9BACT|nr:peptidyl-prolyl cis-trans isomerase [Candidatus Sulfurimonas baltica]QOY51518.1 peptidylprolyl isomerase [Candidatus Sulfurimonas baltica]
MKITTKLVVSLALLSTIVTAQTLATVNDTAITQEDVDRELMQATQGRFNQVPVDKQAEFRKQVLEQLVAKELIYDDAKKTGVLKSKDFKDRYEEVVASIKKEIAIQVWQKREVDKIKISDKDLKSYYDKNKEEFNEKESAHARHILVETEDTAKSIAKELKGLKGVALRNKFMDLAKAKSTGPSGPKGGDLGYFAPGQMVPAFSDKVFSMEVETVSAPVKTQFGYHLIYLEDRKDKQTKSFEEVKEEISQRLKMEQAKAVMIEKMKVLEKKATIK